MKKFINEFKEFALRGNVIDLAVGIIIGSSFQKIVNSLVDDIISPVIGLFTKTDFSDKVIYVGEVSVKYGAFLTSIINFIIMAFVIFIFIKTMNKLNFKNQDKLKSKPNNTSKKCPYCISEINIDAIKCPFCASEIINNK